MPRTSDQRSLLVNIAGFFSLLVVACSVSHAQAVPQSYSLTEINAMFGPEITVEIHRDGSMALMESSGAPSAGFPKGLHARALYDLRAGRSYTVDLINTATPCGVANFSGDWGDPFALSAELLADLAKKSPKVLGTETIAGVPTKVMEVPDSNTQGTSKVWLDEKDKLFMKVEIAAPGNSPKTIIEVKQFSLAKPSASLFAVPPACASAAASAPPSPAAAGGNSANYANAIMPPPSKNSCTVLFKVVEAGTLKPLTTGFQAAIDTQVDVEHMPSYSMGVGQGGRVTFSGGHLHEVTGQMQNGVLRIDNAPPQFDMELAFGQAGDSSALVYRQCYAPETTLLFVIKNRQKLSDGGDWLWVKK